MYSTSIPYSTFFSFFFFFFNDTATTEIYTLSLHDALPIYGTPTFSAAPAKLAIVRGYERMQRAVDRKSTRLNSSHLGISYAVFCLKKKKKKNKLLQIHKKKKNKKTQK